MTTVNQAEMDVITAARAAVYAGHARSCLPPGPARDQAEMDVLLKTGALTRAVMNLDQLTQDEP